MTTIRKWIALTVVAILLVQCGFASVFASESTLVVNESFNAYITNEVPANLSVVGNRSYVCEYKEGEKGYKFELNKSAQGIKFPVNFSGEHFVSFDIVADGAFDGALNFKSGSSTVPFSVISFSDNRLKAHNGKEISGVGTKMKSITVYFDFVQKSYSVTIDGRELASDYYISSMRITAAQEVSFDFTSSDGAYVIVDNINIGNGRPLGKYPVSTYNPDSVERVEYVPVASDDIYLKADLEPGTKLTAAYNGKGNILEKYTEDDGNNCVRFMRTTNSDFHLDNYITTYPSDYIVYQADIKLTSDDVYVTFGFQSQMGFGSNYGILQNGVYTANTKKTKLSVDQWHTISAVFNKYDNVYDVYIDYELLESGVPGNAQYDEKTARIWRFHVGRFNGADEFYMDNFAVYGGKEPKELGDVSFAVSEETSVWAKDDKERAFLADKVSYHLRSGVMYSGESKIVYEPFYVNGSSYVPLEFFADAFGYEVSFDEQTGTAKVADAEFADGLAEAKKSGTAVTMSNAPCFRDGILYLPLRDVCVSVFDKNLYYDNSVPSGGMILISDSEFDIPESIDIKGLNDFALYERPDMERIAKEFEASGFAGVHPRVMATAEDFQRIRESVKTDPNMSRWSKSVIQRANELIKDDTALVYELRDGVRLWYVSLEMIDKITVLAMAYQLTGDKKYADRAWIDMNAVANFPSWHPEHNIDVGAMAVGYAIGYDWMYDAYTPEQRKIIEEGAYSNGFYSFIEGYQGRHQNMVFGLLEEGNHCMVDNAGSSMLGIAFYDVYPQYSAYCISASIRCLEYGIGKYDPEGSWFEGLGYAAMTLKYLSYQFASIDKVFDSLYGLEDTSGVSAVASYYLYIQSPQGAMGFSDGASQSNTFDAGLLWAGDYYNDYTSLTAINNLYGFSADYRNLLWYKPELYNSNVNIPLDKFYMDQQALTMRDYWERDKETTFAAIKGWAPDLGHGHMDMGAFTFFANNCQWTIDYGSEDYNVPGYWSGATIDALRWQYYRVRAEGHNTMVIDPDYNAEYDPAHGVYFTKLEQKPRGVIGIMDLTESSYGKVDSYRRGMYFADDRRSMVIRDEVVPNKESTMYWFMHTKQDAKISDDGKSVILTQTGNPLNYLTVDFVCNVPFEVSIVPATSLPSSPHPEQMTDDSADHKIAVRFVSDKPVNFTAKLTPCTVDGKSVTEFDIPMDTWVIPDGEIPEIPMLDSLMVDGVEYPVSSKNILHTTPADNENFADIEAVSSAYNVDIKYPETIDDTATITVSHPADSSVKTVYRIAYNIYKTIGVPDIEEYAIAKVEASAEPQPENGVMNIIDRDPATRWSATGYQYVLLDMSKIVEFNTVYMNLLEGNLRKFNISISVSEDGIEYKDVFDGTSLGLSDDYEAFDVGMQKARYIKISGNGSNVGSWNSWEDVAIARK